MKARHFLLFAICFLFAGSATTSLAQANDRIKNIEAALPALDEMMRNTAKEKHFPALVYGIVVDGRMIHTGNTGYTNVADKFLANRQSVFRIASMTKSFTASAILKLRDEGKLKLDDPAYLYIPEMKSLKYLTTDAAPVTIRNLLTHTAGLPEDNPWGDRQLATTDAQLLALIKKGISFSNNPATTMEYSNLGFALLGYIVKQVSGVTYQEYITKNILLPLGMAHTYWEYDKVPKKELAHGYRWVNNQWQEQPLLHDGTYGAMGGLMTSLEDFSNYLSFHLLSATPGNTPEKGPLKRSSVREMQRPWSFSQAYNKNTSTGAPCATVINYGYGLSWSKDCNENVTVGHSGGLPGFGSNWKIMPEYGVGIVSMANLTYAPMSAFNTIMLDTLIALAGLKPQKHQASAILTQRKEELLQLLPDWKNAEASGIFADNFFLDYFTDSLKKRATTLFNKAGKINRVGELVPENNLRGSFILEGENSNIEISFTLTPQNPPLIQEYQIRERSKK
ncbi:MAG: serine hydrolase [Chryseobacterium sp. SCN 40-13]|nr:MAG: serine hydrolase [Chryseobacterium sp. SCN 40-13]